MARRRRAPLDETRLHVGGLRADLHRRWPERMLTVGDEITIAVANARTFDPPQREKPKEGPPRPSQDRADLQPQFLNVDLDVWSTAPLDDLAAAFGRNAYALYVGKEGRKYGAHLELARRPVDPERTILRFVALVEGLPRAGKALWKKATVREFNVGIQAGVRPHHYDLHLKPETLLAVARVNARLGFTMYGVDAPGRQPDAMKENP